MNNRHIGVFTTAVFLAILSACAGGQQLPPTFVVTIPPRATAGAGAAESGANALVTVPPEVGGNLAETAAAAWTAVYVEATNQASGAAAPTGSVPEATPDIAGTAYAIATADALATQQAAPPGSTPLPTPAPTATPILSGTGYLWWLNDPKQTVFVTGPSHPRVAVHNGEADEWAARGEACYAEGGSLYALDPSVAAPAGAAGVLVNSGGCNGFRGWVLLAALHASQP